MTELILCLVIANNENSSDSVWLSFLRFDSDWRLFNGLSFFSLLQLDIFTRNFSALSDHVIIIEHLAFLEQIACSNLPSRAGLYHHVNQHVREGDWQVCSIIDIPKFCSKLLKHRGIRLWVVTSWASPHEDTIGLGIRWSEWFYTSWCLSRCFCELLLLSLKFFFFLFSLILFLLEVFLDFWISFFLLLLLNWRFNWLLISSILDYFWFLLLLTLLFVFIRLLDFLIELNDFISDLFAFFLRCLE